MGTPAKRIARELPAGAESKEHVSTLFWSWVAAFLFFFVRFWFAQKIDLAPDEAYYWEWSRHPALSYYDQGPMLALAIRLGTWLFGSTPLGVRFPALACGLALSALSIWVGVRVLGSRKAALWLVLGLNSMLLYSAGGILMVHDSLQVTFWAAAFCCVLKAVGGDQPEHRGVSGWWLLAGLLGGAGLLSKYTGVFLFPLTGLAIVTHPGLRKQGQSPGPWVALLLGILSGLPILWWNWQNHWPSFRHVFSLAGGDSSRHSFSTLPEFLGSQFGLVTPLYLGLVLAAWWDTWKRRVDADGVEWLFWCVSLPLFLFFLVMSFRTRVEGNWTAPAWFGGFCLVALHQMGRPSRKTISWAFGLALGMSVLVHLQAMAPFLPLKPGQARVDGAARVAGWKELGAEASRASVDMKPGSFLAAQSYQNAAELSFYTSGQPGCVLLGEGELNHQYRFWNHPESEVGKDALLVVDREGQGVDLKNRFQDIRLVKRVALVRHGIEVRERWLFQGFGFKG
jgi:hypothetical protein